MHKNVRELTREKMFDVVTMGEIMLRLSSPRYERISRGDTFEKRAGGAELNVAMGTALMGLRSAVITKVPNHQLGTLIKNRVRFGGVSDALFIYDDDSHSRLGTYYYEYGAYPRKPSLVYDRDNSAFTTIKFDEIPAEVYTNARLFHTSGITMGVSKQAKDTAIEAIKAFKAGGAIISYDINYRSRLLTEEEAREIYYEVAPYLDVLFVSEETSRRLMQKTGTLEQMMKSYTEGTDIKYVLTTQRTVHSPKIHDFTSMVYSKEEDKFYTEPPFEQIEVIDRIGSGDAYCAGALYALLEHGTPDKMVSYGNAYSATKNTILGDLPATDRQEIESIIRAHTATGYVNEIDR